MAVDTAPGTVTAPVPVITSGAEAIRAARDYAASIAGGAIERDRSGTVPGRELAALDATGLLGITVPRAYGGPDLPATVLADVVRELAAVLAGARLSNGMAERGGPHAQDLKTKLIRAGTGLRLSGRKYYCTGGGAAFDDVAVDPCLVIPYHQGARPFFEAARAGWAQAATAAPHTIYGYGQLATELAAQVASDLLLPPNHGQL